MTHNIFYLELVRLSTGNTDLLSGDEFKLNVHAQNTSYIQSIFLICKYLSSKEYQLQFVDWHQFFNY